MNNFRFFLAVFSQITLQSNRNQFDKKKGLFLMKRLNLDHAVNMNHLHCNFCIYVTFYAANMFQLIDNK